MRGFVGQARGSKLIAELSRLGIGEATQPGEFPPRRHPWFLDNGAFWRWRKGLPFDHELFRATITRCCAYKPDPEWIVLPDVVGDGEKSMALSLQYLWGIKTLGFRVAFVVQDGMTPETFPQWLWEAIDVIFVGGSLGWKLSEAHRWTKAARIHGKLCHIGRVGSARRVNWAHSIGADSVDSCVPLWSSNKLRVWSEALNGSMKQLGFSWQPTPPARVLVINKKEKASK